MIVSDSLLDRPTERHLVQPALLAVRSDRRDLGLLRGEAALHRRVAGQVDAFLDADHRRQRQLVRLAAGVRLALHVGDAVVDVSPLPPLTIGRPSAWATRMPTWKPPESADSLPNRIRSNSPSAASIWRTAAVIACAVRCGSQSPSPIGSSTAFVHADRHCVAKLLLGLGRSERQHRRFASVLLDELGGGLDRALLVRRRGECEVGGVDLLPVSRDVDARPGCRHPLHAHQDPHAGSVFMRVSSGSNSGWLPTRATVTGYCSFM